MHLTSTWQQTAVYNPNDPTQRERVAWANPGGFATYYWNRVPDAGTLGGLGAGFSSLPTAAQIGIVTVAAAVAGFFGWRAVGDRYVRPAIKKLGFASARRRR